jgi:crotonobetaine/carnitine-CoA ligase
MMKNSPRWLDVFFAAEKLGMCVVPVNVALRGDQLAHIFENSRSNVAVVDEDLLPIYQAVADRLPGIENVAVNPAPEAGTLPQGVANLDEAYGYPETRPSVKYDTKDLCLIMYTSGTTGLPKGVVYRYENTNVKALSLLGRLLVNPDDVAYTCYPLFHANALFLSITPSLHAGCKMVLDTKFSASRFWDQMRRYGVTTFNGLGAVMPILMKQPPQSDDRDNPVRFILSAGCPTDIWRDFEQRFDLQIFEGYGAVDGGAVLLVNFGTAPVGSMGKPLGAKIRIVDAEGNEVPPRSPGEMIAYVGNGNDSVQYHEDEKATSSKVRDGWLYTGDLVYRDEKKNIYFVGRNTESMRVGGENVSALEVENAVLKHPDILECAAYAVPSELVEDEIMVTFSCVEGKSVDLAGLPGFLADHLAKFAVPRYYRVIPEMPKTETHRIIKNDLESLGVIEDTYDAKKERVN